MGRGNPHLFTIIVNSPVNDKRVASMHCRPVESRDTPLSRSQRSADRSSDRHQRDRASTSLIRMPEDPRAAEPRGLESRQILGRTPLSGGGIIAAPSAETPSPRGGSTGGLQKIPSADRRGYPYARMLGDRIRAEIEG
jgi:hypothetical protein